MIQARASPPYGTLFQYFTAAWGRRLTSRTMSLPVAHTAHGIEGMQRITSRASRAHDRASRLQAFRRHGRAAVSFLRRSPACPTIVLTGMSPPARAPSNKGAVWRILVIK